MGSQGTIPQWKTNVQDLDISTISEADDALQASFQKSRTLVKVALWTPHKNPQETSKGK
jgi:hypothetical protein